MLLTSILLTGQNSPGVYTVKNAKINTLDSDFGTAFYGDDKVVFAAPKQGFTLSREENSGQPFLDLYVGEVTEDGQIIKKQKLPGEINTKYHEGMVSFTKDLKTVYFSANNFVKQKKKKNKKKATGYLHLFRADITESGEWTNLTMLPFNGEKFSTGHPVLNRDDTKLYFVSDRPESYGKTDLFVVDIREDGSFSEPRNLGANINTSEREMFPFIGKDNVLYFSSDGLPGLGELDVFASKIFDSTQSEPINLQEPVNSEFDDFAYIIDDHKSRGYFSSNREGGHGDDDIYSFVASPPIYIECQQEISGVVRDIDTQELIPDALIVLYDAKGKELESFISSKENASFSFEQSCNTNYTIKGYLEGYLIGELDIKTVNDLNAPPIDIILHLTTDPDAVQNVIASTNTLDENGTSDELNTSGDDAVTEQSSANIKDNSSSVSQVNGDAKPVQANSNSMAAAGTTGLVAASKINDREEEENSDESTVVASQSDVESNSELAIKSEENVNPNQSKEVSRAEAEAGVYASSAMVISNDENTIDASIADDDTSVEKASEIEVVGSSNDQELESEIQKTSADEVSSNLNESQIADGETIGMTAEEIQKQKEELNSQTVTKKEVSVQNIEGAKSEEESVLAERSEDEKSINEKELSDTTNKPEIAMNMTSDVSETEQDAMTASSPIVGGTEGIKINTIYFDFDKHDIRFDAKIELDKIAVVLKENPQTKIKVHSHTDSRGKKSYNSKLSNHRARKTVQYLLEKGIEEERITGEGHGELELAEVCTKQLPCTELRHQLNRRSEFLIVDSFSDAVIAQSFNKPASGNYAVNKNVSNSGAYINYDFSDNREVYTVQVGAFKGEVQNDKYKKLTDLFNYRYEDGLNRYYAGIFESSAEARIYMKKMRKNGFADAFVVGLKGTDRF